MTRISSLFDQKRKNILNIYCTAGFPHIESTIEVLMALQNNGADMVELGIPYSDPVADGPVIQQSNSVAINNGITIQKIFDQLTSLRTRFHLPFLLMGYLNPVMQYGVEKFCSKAKDCGVDGIILPDLPLYEYETEYRKIVDRYGLDFIFLITPETSNERIRKIDELSNGFIYAVSTSSTTGKNNDPDAQQEYFKKLQDMKLKNPVLVGFGISNKSSFQKASKYTNGAIIGTAYIKALLNPGTVENNTKQFLNEILN